MKFAIILALCLRIGVALSAQEPGRGPIQASFEREATRLEAAAFQTPAVQTERSDDWDAVGRLSDGTRVIVSTGRGRRINGKLTAVSNDTLQLAIRWGRRVTLARADIDEVRLGHSVGVGQAAALGSLLGGVAGFVGGNAACSPAECRDAEGMAIYGRTVGGTFFGGIGGLVVGLAVHARPGRLIYALAKP